MGIVAKDRAAISDNMVSMWLVLKSDSLVVLGRVVARSGGPLTA